MRRRFSKGVIAIIAIVAVLAVAITVGLFTLLNRVTPLTEAGEGCTVTTPEGSLDLEIEQAQVAATIAAVAARRKLPERAVVIAYATAIQESKLLNLAGDGDRDSVGVFQQRPSQGWGKPEQLVDPVYASGKFFAALVKVKNYRKLPLHEAAQEVQRSADGSAYAQHEDDGEDPRRGVHRTRPQGRALLVPGPHRQAGDSPGKAPVSTGTETPLPGAEKARRKLARALGPGTHARGLLAEARLADGQLVGRPRPGVRAAPGPLRRPDLDLRDGRRGLEGRRRGLRRAGSRSPSPATACRACPGVDPDRSARRVLARARIASSPILMVPGGSGCA